MTRHDCGRAALIAAIGLLIFSAAPSQAAPADDGDAAVETTAQAGKPLALTATKKPRIKKAGRKAAKVAAIKAGKKAKQAKITAPAPEPPIPEAVANANAQMPSAEARGVTSVGETPALEAAAAEQLNELGKSLNAPPAEEPQQIAQLSAPEPQVTPAVEAPEPNRPLKQARVAPTNDAWAQSSLIGKIFIAFGGLLTLASAARMLVA